MSSSPDRLGLVQRGRDRPGHLGDRVQVDALVAVDRDPQQVPPPDPADVEVLQVVAGRHHDGLDHLAQSLAVRTGVAGPSIPQTAGAAIPLLSHDRHLFLHRPDGRTAARRLRRMRGRLSAERNAR